MNRCSRCPVRQNSKEWPRALFVLVILCSLPPAGRSDEKAPARAPLDRSSLLKTFAEEFVEITPGEEKFPKSFEMGSASGTSSERPVHMVTLERPFAIARYEVPQNLYEAVMGKNPSVWGGPRNSVEMVSWIEAVQFCRRATALMRAEKLIGDDEEIRLPTEAEWEYSCRAGTSTSYSFGDAATADGETGNKASKLDPYGWHTGNAAGNDPPVGALKPNAWGLYDMHGYLWEYVADAWHPGYDGAPSDGTARDASKTGNVPRVMRGGSWRDHFTNLRSSTRWSIPDHARSDAIGFRCVKSTVAGR